MTDTVRGLRRDGRVRLPAVSALIEAGDLLFYSAGSAAPASEMADQGSEPLNQQEFKRLFLGVAEERSPDGTTDEISILVDPLIEYEFVSPSTTWSTGDLVGASEDAAGTGLEDQQLEQVTDPAEAIGVAIREDTAAQTVVRCLLFSTMAGPRGLLDGGALAGANVETLAANRTLGAGEPSVQILDPGGAARTVTLPAEAEGLEFTIINAADGDEPITVNDDTPAAVAVIERHGRLRLISDGTSWFVMAQHDATNEVNVETLASGKTLGATDPRTQLLDCGGADRTLTLPAEAAAVGAGVYHVKNTSDADETLTIEDDANAAVKYLRQGEFCMLACDGAAWHLLSEGFDGAPPAATRTGTQTLTDLDLPTQLIDPQGSVNVDLPAEAATNRPFTIKNTGSGGEVITIRDDAAATVASIDADEVAVLVPTGSAWHGYFGVKAT